MTVNNTGENNTLQIIGEIYTASKPLSEMSGHGIHRRDGWIAVSSPSAATPAP